MLLLPCLLAWSPLNGRLWLPQQTLALESLPSPAHLEGLHFVLAHPTSVENTREVEAFDADPLPNCDWALESEISGMRLDISKWTKARLTESALTRGFPFSEGDITTCFSKSASSTQWDLLHQQSI